MSLVNKKQHSFDVCVIGGGMAGVCAAIAAARGGARTALVHDRPVYGGNASSEVRMWICGAHGKFNKEAGILEEIQLANLYHNEALNYSIWDSVLWAKIRFEGNLTPFLNCSCLGAEMDSERIGGITAWQGTSQTEHNIAAKLFIDCSGDSILAALTPAEFRQGREARHEFDEDIEPGEADGKTMGNSLLIQMRRTDSPQPFTAPRWAYEFESPADLQHRLNGVNGHNFWWLEVGGLDDTIADAEEIRDELMKIAYGAWDYIKNRAPERAASENWAVEWIGSVPGKRENRRYIGDHTLTQNDIRDGGNFEDIVAYGGWPMDDHHPAGLYYTGEPTIFHPAPSPYGISFRCLYSRNVPNLLFAGRNISVTHAALSSTRVMATCALLGQAAGTAAALCARDGLAPRALSTGARLAELQDILELTDCWLPGRRRAISDLGRSAKLVADGENAEALRDGIDRDLENEEHAYTAALGQPIEYRFGRVEPVGGVRILFDSNLQHEKRMPCSYPQNATSRVPASLVRSFRIEARGENGNWTVVHDEPDNYQRLVMVALEVEATAMRLVPESTWGAPVARIFGFEPLVSAPQASTQYPDGANFKTVRSRIPAEDLAPPEILEAASFAMPRPDWRSA